MLCCLHITGNRVIFTVGEYYGGYMLCLQELFLICSLPLLSVFRVCRLLFCQLSSQVGLVYECCVWMSPSLLSGLPERLCMGTHSHQMFLTEVDGLKRQFPLSVMWLMRPRWLAPESFSAKHSGWHTGSMMSVRVDAVVKQIYLSEIGQEKNPLVNS